MKLACIIGELEHLFPIEDLEKYADQCQIPSSRLRQEFSVSEIESCDFLKQLLTDRLLPFSRYFFGLKTCDEQLAVALTCGSTRLWTDLELMRYRMWKFASIQDQESSDCDTGASELVLRNFLLSFFPTKSRFEL